MNLSLLEYLLEMSFRSPRGALMHGLKKTVVRMGHWRQIISKTTIQFTASVRHRGIFVFFGLGPQVLVGMAPLAGLEPATKWLTATRSTN